VLRISPLPIDPLVIQDFFNVVLLVVLIEE